MKTNHLNIRFWRLLNSFSNSFFPLLVINSFINGIRPYYNLLLSAEIVNKLVENADLQIITKYVLFLIVGNFILLVIEGWLSYFASNSELNLVHSEARCFFKKYLSMDYCDFENSDVRQLRRRIIESSRIAGHGRQLYITSVKRITDNSFGICFAFVISLDLLYNCFSNSSLLVSIAFLFATSTFVTISVWYSFYTQKKTANQAKQISKTMTDNNRVDGAVNCYNMGKDVRIFNQVPIIMEIKKKRLTLHKKAFRAYSLFQFKTGIPLIVLTNCLNIIIYGFVVFNAINGSIEIGNIIKYVVLPQKIIECIIGIFKGFADLKSNKPFLEDYLSYIDRPSQWLDNTNALPMISFTKGNDLIEFKNVSFKYPGSEKYALNSISIKIKCGESLAVVGENGSGKTTFIKLLCRLYDPNNGVIILNGKDLREYSHNAVSSFLSVIFQDFKLFSFSLAENVSASANYDEIKVVHSLNEAGFGERLQDMPYEINTVLYKDFDKTGVEISGGEAQKIAIARTIYKDAPIVILDEPTAALDPIAESEIYSKLNKIASDKTAIFISHRLSSCRFCDRIAVFDDGRIVQLGTHEALVADEAGKYYQLWSAQAQYYT